MVMRLQALCPALQRFLMYYILSSPDCLLLHSKKGNREFVNKNDFFSCPFFQMNAAFNRKYKLRGNFAVQFVSCEDLPHYTLPLALKFSILFEMEVG